MMGFCEVVVKRHGGVAIEGKDLAEVIFPELYGPFKRF